MSLVLVTGASTGLGLATARALLDDGHEVVLHARRLERVEDADVLDRVTSAVEADLADLDAVVRLADDLNETGTFDAVVHNAGVMRGPDVVPVNVVAPYVLAALLRRPRTSVVLSSSMHRSGSPDLTADVAQASYSDSKLWVTALTLALAVRRPDEAWHAVDPGWVPTRMGGSGAPDDLDEGHRTQVWLATAGEGEVEPRTGGYWYHRAASRLHPAALDPAFQDDLLGRLERRTGIALQP
ncbi:SDR family NAD(P)-dependent oxidoreductase [Nocardioides plantarum]|uniref:SDR family NAD(P)-dependent oxidoreductase n=1 Tax=Nocardioides plantarum TaxID=29299 RepID=A0ABV5KFH2_9ACTN|nr:SDR family NAD(P)-dependent oxidoreductase [Nocardioides plantarum]